MIYTLAFWKGALERAIKTVAQTLVAVLSVGAVGVLEVDWVGALSAAGLAGVVSALTSIAAPTNVPNETGEEYGE